MSANSRNPFVEKSPADTAYLVGAGLSCLSQLVGQAAADADGLRLDSTQAHGLQLLLVTLAAALEEGGAFIEGEEAVG